MNRRYFIQSSLVATALSKQLVAASDKVNLALMGVRGRGRSLAQDFAALPDVSIPYLCDVDENVFGPAAKIVEEKKGVKPKLIGDIRRALDDKNVDAIVIATPDHWHAPATILGCQAGKDVYVEKPCSHNLKEGRLMVQAARTHQRVVQHGTGYRSFPTFIRSVEAVRAGKIGKALAAKAWDVQMRDDIGHKEDSPVPAGVDFDTWTGPAPMLPFNENRFHYNWHWHWNYGTGDAGNDGVHQIDVARWALGVEEPLEVSGMGRKLYFDDDQKTPDTVNVTFEYKDKTLVFEMRIWNPYGMEGQQNGVAIYGSEGVMHIGRWPSEKGGRKHGYRIYDRQHKLAFEDCETEDQNWHARNFIDCIRSRKAPNAEIAIGHTSTLHAHLANIVVRTGQPLKFDANLETVFGNESAQKLLGRKYRPHWATPKQT